MPPVFKVKVSPFHLFIDMTWCVKNCLHLTLSVGSMLPRLARRIFSNSCTLKVTWAVKIEDATEVTIITLIMVNITQLHLPQCVAV